MPSRHVLSARPPKNAGPANVDFTDADKDGTDVTQTFRVLAAWVNEPAAWRIVQTQWSNPR